MARPNYEQTHPTPADLADLLDVIQRLVLGVVNGTLAPVDLPQTVDLNRLEANLEPYMKGQRAEVLTVVEELGSLRSYLPPGPEGVPRALRPEHQDAINRLHTALNRLVGRLRAIPRG